MKRILFVLFAALTIFSTDAFASKAVTRPRLVTLQDGRQVVVSLRGDEHFSYYASSTGELIIREGNLWRVATETELHEAEQCFNNTMRKTGEAITGTRTFPHIGNPKALVILVSFSDKDFFYTKDDIEPLFNSTEYNSESGRCSYSSLAQYMNDCSEGQYRPEFDVVGPYQLSGTVAYYGSNTSGKDANIGQFVKDACTAADADVDFSQYDADGDGYVDLVYIVYAGYGENWGGSTDYLWPKSGHGYYGNFDGVNIYRYGINNELMGWEISASDYYTAKEAADKNKSNLVADSEGRQPGEEGYVTTYKDGYTPVSAGDLKSGPWDSKGNPYLGGIGVLAHEFCHTLGLPDVYPTAKWWLDEEKKTLDVIKYDNQSMEYWDLMDGGENNFNGYYPTPLTAFERELFGWMKIDTLANAANVEMKPLQDGGKAYRIMNDNDETGNEYYILEAIPNGKGSGWYRRMRGNGLLVTHINYDVNKFSNFNNPNNVQGEPRWTIIPADGIIMSSYRNDLSATDPNYITSTQYYADQAGDTYPGTSNVTELTDYKAYIGVVEKPITEIAQEGFNISFKFMGGVDGIETITTNANSSTATYNLQGQKVADDYRGIVIRDGKKYLKK